jgi:hypothetical protein
MKVKIKSSQKQIAQGHPQVFLPKTDSFIIRCIKIVFDDIRRKIHKPKEDAEKYNEFCRLARGER